VREGLKMNKIIRKFEEVFKEQNDDDKNSNVFYTGVSDTTIIKFVKSLSTPNPKEGSKSNI